MDNSWMIGPVVLVVLAVALVVLAFLLQRGCRRNARIREEKRELVSGLLGLLPGLKILRDNLEKIAPDEFSTDPMTDLVAFFGITSLWHDLLEGDLRDICKKLGAANIEGFEGIATEFQVFRSQIIAAGRKKNGWNRTVVGQQVTDDRVCLGDIHGLFTKSVAFWKTKVDAEPREYPGIIEPTTAYEIVSKQAQGFHKAHSDLLLETLERLIQWIEAFETESTGQIRLQMSASSASA